MVSNTPTESVFHGQRNTFHVIQGEYRVSAEPGIVLSTVLGSCVSACIFDPLKRIGGMNHFLLPETEAGNGDVRYAVAAMEQLVNALLKAGAAKHRMEAKLFGGARMMAGLPDIGRRNGKTAHWFLSTEGIRCTSESLGGDRARRIRFWPESGRVQQMLLDPMVTDPVTPAAPRARAPVGEVELF